MASERSQELSFQSLATKHIDLKQVELDTAVAKVDELSRQLDSLWTDSPGQAAEPPKVDRYSASPMHAPVPLRMATSPQLQHARRSVSLEPTDGYVNYRAETLPAGSQPPKASLGRPASPQSPFYLAGELPERAQSPRPKVDRYSASPMHAPVPLRMATSPQLQHARRSVSLEPTDGYITYRAETLPAGSQPPKASLGRPASPQSPFYLAGELPERAQSPRPKVLPVSLPLPSPKGRAPSPRPLWPAGAPEHLSARPVGRAGSPRLAPAPSEGPAPQMFFPERAPSPRPAAYESHSAFPAGPSSFAPFRTQDDLVIRRRAQRSWNESDLDVAYEKKSSHSAAFERGDVPLGPRPVPAGLQLALWRESSLDGAAGKGKDDPSQLYAVHSATLPRNYKASPLAGERQDSSFRRLLPPSQTGTLPRSWQFSQQPVSRIAMPPPSLPGLRAKPHKPLPLSMIFKLQNAFWASGASGAKSQLQGPPGSPLFLRSLQKPQPLPPSPAAQAPPRLAPSGGEVTGRAPAPEALAEPGRGAPAGGDAEPELESILRGGEPAEAEEVPRPLSPTRLQPVLPPEAQKVPEFEEVARVLAEIPRPLKRRGSMEQSPGPALPPTHKKQYQQLISRLFHHRSRKEEALPPADAPADMTPIPEAAELKEGASLSPAPAPASQSPSVPAATPLLAVTETPPGPRPRTPSPETRSVLRKLSSPRRAGRRVRLNPLVLLLDGALTGELDVVQQAVSELHDSSQPNDEGITALHNAICGANYNIVDFLIAVGANVNSPDSHGWTPLHCAASCNDTVICMALIRHGAAIFTTTFSDGSTALEKCDPYREGYTECSSYLADVEQNTGRLNSGVVYALWDYAAEFGDELSFREGEPVTVLRRDGPEELGWWWASLYGQEGYVPRNYFGLFPRVKPQQQQKV